MEMKYHTTNKFIRVQPVTDESGEVVKIIVKRKVKPPSVTKIINSKYRDYANRQKRIAKYKDDPYVDTTK